MSEDKTTNDPFADTDRLTCRDPDLDLDALERAHGRVLSLYRSCIVGGAASVAAEWEALLVASGYGWPARPKAPPRNHYDGPESDRQNGR